MTEKEVLLDAICRHPDDDTPRLMYAGLLERERRHARAEVIRAQVTLASMGPDDEGRPALATRVNKLLNRHGSRWMSEEAGPGAGEVRFQRGFIERLATTARQFVSRAQRTRRMPLRAVRLYRAAGYGAEIARRLNEWPLDGLDIRDGKFGDDDLAALAGGAMGRPPGKLTILGGPGK